MITKRYSAIALTTFALMLSSCSQQRDLLLSKSGLYDVPLESSYKIPLKGYWVSDEPIHFKNIKRGEIYVAKLDTSLIKDKYPTIAEHLCASMQIYMHEDLNKTLELHNEKNKIQWHVSDNRQEAEICIEIAVVKFKMQKPILKFISTIGGYFMPIPGVSSVTDYIAAGDIVIEVSVSDAKTKQLYFAFKDKNRKSTRLYSKHAYSRDGAADANLKYWSQFIAKIIYSGKANADGKLSFKGMLDSRKSGDLVKDYFNASI